MKRLFIFALFVFSIFVATAQRFEWAKGYTVEGYMYRSIVGGVTDSLGNLYILGNCDATSVWERTEDIIPSIHKSTKNLYNDILIAKISPEGEMVWKKVIFGKTSYFPYGIKKLGDTAFACLTNFRGMNTLDYCYFLDTLVFHQNNYPIDPKYFVSSYLAYMVFDFDGNLKEQHFLTITYTDADGNDIVKRYPNHVDTTPWLMGIEGFMYPSFDVDGEGNIYISRMAQDRCDGGGHALTPEDTIRGLKFWVDRRMVGEYRIEGFPKQWYPQLIKFAPHFDTLLTCRYVVQSDDSMYIYDAVDNYRVMVDSIGVYYLHSMRQHRYNSTLLIDSLSQISFSITERNQVVPFLVKYDTELNAKWVIAFEDSVLDSTRDTRTTFHDFSFDTDSNLLFLYAVTGRGSYRDTVNLFSILTYNGEPLNLKSNVFFCAFENGDVNPPTLHSYGKVPETYLSANNVKGTCRNNRVFLQSQYGGGITFPSQTITHGTYEDGYALTVFDYSGKVIDGIDYGIVASNVSHYAGPTVLHDSVLYLCTLLKTSAQFGDISFPVYGETNVIAKYVDTAFMHLYVRPTLGISTVSAVTPRVYPVPATDRLHFDCPAGGVPTAVAAISLSGWRMPLTATASSADVSCLAPGVYLLEITTAKDKYYTKFVKR